MRFLVDQCLARRTVQVLERLGHEAIYVRDIPEVNHKKDRIVFAYARKNGLIVVTLDKAFDKDAGQPYAGSPGILVIDPGPLDTPRVYLPLLQRYIPLIGADFIEGSLVTLSDAGFTRTPGQTSAVTT